MLLGTSATVTNKDSPTRVALQNDCIPDGCRVIYDYNIFYLITVSMTQPFEGFQFLAKDSKRLVPLVLIVFVSSWFLSCRNAKQRDDKALKLEAVGAKMKDTLCL